MPVTALPNPQRSCNLGSFDSICAAESNSQENVRIMRTRAGNAPSPRAPLTVDGTVLGTVASVGRNALAQLERSRKSGAESSSQGKRDARCTSYIRRLAGLGQAVFVISASALGKPRSGHRVAMIANSGSPLLYYAASMQNMVISGSY